MAHQDDDLLALFGDDTGADLGPGDSEGVEASVPNGVVQYVRSITRSPWVIQQVLDVATSRVMRRSRTDSPAARRARWESRWRPEEQARTMRMLGRVRDQVVRHQHFGNVAVHTTFTTTPGSLKAWRPNKEGVLVVDEPMHLSPSFGSPAFLEVTPTQVLRFIHETWAGRKVLGELDLDETWRNPRVWDLTAGSGSGRDYFGLLHGCSVISSDLTVVSGEGVALADCREVGLLAQHGARRRHLLAKPELIVAEPDIILFDPSSAGPPTCSAIYGDGTHSQDLAVLERNQWVFAVADVTTRAARHLADGGLLSLLVRCGRRLHQQVDEDGDLLDDLRTVLEGRVRIMHEMPLAYRHRHPQTSLGLNRVPAVHLTIGKLP